LSARDTEHNSEATVLKVKVLRPGAKLPERGSAGATGYDLYACLDDLGVIIIEDKPELVPTGIALEVPPGFDAQIRPRSGLFARGVAVALGTIDSDYRGEVLVTMYLLPSTPRYEVKHGDRIAQLVISRVADVPLVEVEELSETERGNRGHGSTGM